MVPKPDQVLPGQGQRVDGAYWQAKYRGHGGGGSHPTIVVCDDAAAALTSHHITWCCRAGYAGGGCSCSYQTGVTEEFIYTRDMDWLRTAECVISEVTQPSLGTKCACVAGFGCVCASHRHRLLARSCLL